MCATLIGARTGQSTRGSVVVHEKPGLATLARGPAVCSAGVAGFGIAVRTSARCTDKHGFQALIRV